MNLDRSYKINLYSLAKGHRGKLRAHDAEYVFHVCLVKSKVYWIFSSLPMFNTHTLLIGNNHTS